jgi:hypothetical protein
MKIPELIRDIEARMLSEQRRESDASAKLKRIADLAEAEGRKRFSVAEDAEPDRLMLEVHLASPTRRSQPLNEPKSCHAGQWCLTSMLCWCPILG